MTKLENPPISMGKILGGIVLVTLLLVWLISYFIEGPLRRRWKRGEFFFGGLYCPPAGGRFSSRWIFDNAEGPGDPAERLP